MSEEINAATPDPQTPPILQPPPVPYVPPAHPPMYWVKRMLACNPFYLISAALLLFGMYRTSVDKNFLPTEVGQLVFNFSSLQFYELLLVVTAVILARRCIWYDSTLLIVLENLFVLVPFFLISQAALIDQNITGLLCGVAAMLAIGRFSAGRKWIPPLRFSPQLLTAGGMVLAMNAVLPMVYRHLHETKFGTKLASGSAYEMNEMSWLVLVPLLCAIPLILPRPQSKGELVVQRRWFPIGLVLLWLVGSLVHLYSLGYIYDFDLRRELAAPALVVLAWMLHFRLKDFVESPTAQMQVTTLLLPVVVSLVAVGVDGSNVFFGLMTLNALVLVGFFFLQPDNRVARQLLCVVIGILVTAIPGDWTTTATTHLDRSRLIGIVSVTYLLLAAAFSQNPKVGLAGMVAAAVAAGALRVNEHDCGYWAMQAGMVFLLLHSLRWNDREHQGANVVRNGAAMVWVLHSFIWVNTGAAFWHPMMMAAILAAGYFFWTFLTDDWAPRIVPIASAAVALSSPLSLTVSKTQTAPMGVLAIAGSFVLFAIGTAMALTKHRWHKHEPPAARHS